MRLSDLFEDSQPSRLIVATSRFLKEYPKFAKKYKAFKTNLRDFLEFRETARVDQPYNSKDGMLSGEIWRGLGLRRVHLIHGKALVIYSIASNEIRLVMIGEHDDIEGSSINKLATFARSLTPSDYSRFGVPDETPVERPQEPVRAMLTPAQVDDLRSLFLLLAHSPDDRAVIEKAAQGKIDEFMEWARMTLDFEDPSHDDAILNALGGRNALVKHAGLWLKNTAS